MVRYDVPIRACIRRGRPMVRYVGIWVVAVEQFVRSYLVLATTTNHKKGKTHLPQTRARRILPGVSPACLQHIAFC